MAGIPTFFQAISNILANYDFVDITSGTGYINFYAGRTTALELLSNYPFFSDQIFSNSTIPDNSSDALLLDFDFDAYLNRPLVVGGRCVLNVPVGIFSTSSASNNCYVVATVRKWDGVTETDLCANYSTTLTLNTGGSSGSIYKMFGIDLNIPLTNFKRGEYLRLTIQLYGGNPSGSNGIAYLGHDPKSRTAGFDTTGATPSQLVFQLPVRLNL